MEELNFNHIEITFKEAQDNMSKSITMNVMLFGKLGTGKSTVISVTEGYYASLNKEVTERNISDDGRGTKEIEKLV